MAQAQAARENPNLVPVDDLYIPDWDIREGRPEEDIDAVARSLQECNRQHGPGHTVKHG